jgi:hypothetical protein
MTAQKKTILEHSSNMSSHHVSLTEGSLWRVKSNATQPSHPDYMLPSVMADLLRSGQQKASFGVALKMISVACNASR